MPIRRELRGLYAIDWRELSFVIRFERAKGRCEHCGRPHGVSVLTSSTGLWFDKPGGCWRDARGTRAERPVRPYRLRFSAARLATAHLDHDPTNNRASNLAALCQRCHLAHDRADNRRRAAITVSMRRALGDLFTGPYPRSSGW